MESDASSHLAGLMLHLQLQRVSARLSLLFAISQVLWTESLRQHSGDRLDSDSCIADIAFLQENEALCVSSSSGQLLLVPSPTDIQEVCRKFT